jgi:hypothetical protein
MGEGGVLKVKSQEKMMRPIFLEIVTPVVTTYDHCRHCTPFFEQSGLQKQFDQKTMNDYPEDLKEDFVRLSNWIRELCKLYQHRLLIKLIDAYSPVGFYKSLRHRIRKYPAFIVEKKETFVGWDKNKLEEILDRYMQSAALLRRQGQPSASH